MANTFIYGLFDPTTDELRYIGKANNPKSRLRQHIYDAIHFINEGTHTLNWIRKLLRSGERPNLEVLEEVSEDKWQEAERKWIRICRSFGYRLTNTVEGGIAPEVTEEIRRKISEKKRGGQHSEETKRKIGLKSIGRQANLGNRHTEETKRKISESKKGRKLSDEHISKAIEGRKGYRHSEETKARIGMSNSIAVKAYWKKRKASK